jgi:hypothetical protein
MYPVFWKTMKQQRDDKKYFVNYVRPVVSYGAEAWTMTKKEEQALLIFERKIF